MKLICTYLGKCLWHDWNGVCGAFCPHKDMRRLIVRKKPGKKLIEYDEVRK